MHLQFFDEFGSIGVDIGRRLWWWIIILGSMFDTWVSVTASAADRGSDGLGGRIRLLLLGVIVLFDNGIGHMMFLLFRAVILFNNN